MNTPADAWDWYVATRRNLERMQRLGKKYWNAVALQSEAIGRDDQFKNLLASDIEDETARSLKPIDDLAVVVLFSVFESLVRGHLVALIQPEVDRLSDPILKHAGEDAIRGVEEGSFYRCVLEPLRDQGRVPAELVTQVNQVRDYRNWVAHGRRETPKNNVTPRMAFDRLKTLLDALEIAVQPEHLEPERPGTEHE
jgi:hypothetical protein